MSIAGQIDARKAFPDFCEARGQFQAACVAFCGRWPSVEDVRDANARLTKAHRALTDVANRPLEPSEASDYSRLSSELYIRTKELFGRGTALPPDRAHTTATLRSGLSLGKISGRAYFAEVRLGVDARNAKSAKNANADEAVNWFGIALYKSRTTKERTLLDVARADRPAMGTNLSQQVLGEHVLSLLDVQDVLAFTGARVEGHDVPYVPAERMSVVKSLR